MKQGGVSRSTFCVFRPDVFLLSCSPRWFNVPFRSSLIAPPDCHPWDLRTRKRAYSSWRISFAGDLKQGFSLVLKYPNNPSTKNETVNLSPGLFALLLSSALVLSQLILGQLAQNQKRTCVLMKYRRERKGTRVFQTPFHQVWHQTLYTYFHLKTTKTL